MIFKLIRKALFWVKININILLKLIGGLLYAMMYHNNISLKFDTILPLGESNEIFTKANFEKFSHKNKLY